MRGLAIAAGFLLVSTVALDGLGVAGYRGGFLAVAALLACAGVAVAWVAIGAAAGRPLWMLTVAVIGLVLAGVLVDRAPLSKARLAAEMDALQLPLYRVLEETREGTSWCRPSCPAVRRVYDVPPVDRRAIRVEVANALQQAGFRVDISRAVTQTGPLDASKEKIRAQFATPTGEATSAADTVLTFSSSR